MISLHINNLSKSYNGHQVLRNISLEHTRGVLGISGPNGSGKSTLLKCLAALESITSGTVQWLDNKQEISTINLKKELGFAAPYISMYQELTVIENLKFLQKSRPDSVLPHLTAILEQVGLTEIGSQHYGSLSTGQQQRAKLASALFHDPNVLILDEPGANLDEAGRLLVNDILEQAKKQGKLVILASNNPDELDLCDRVYSVEGMGL